jgi:hypothetical protein
MCFPNPFPVKQKIKLICIGILVHLAAIEYCDAQYIVAGQTGPGIFHYSLNPEFDLNTDSAIWGQKQLDLDHDNTFDFTFFVENDMGISHDISISTITPEPGRQVSCSRREAVYNLYSHDSVYEYVVKIYQPGDTIRYGASFNDQQGAFNYKYWLTGQDPFNIVDWYTSGENYAGIILRRGSDTAIGWMKVYTPVFSRIIIREYALKWMPSSVEEYKANSLRVYPDPATDEVMVVPGATSSVPERLVVSDISGKEVVTFTSSDFSGGKCTIDVSGFRDGLYFVSLFRKKSVTCSKFIVKH